MEAISNLELLQHSRICIALLLCVCVYILAITLGLRPGGTVPGVPQSNIVGGSALGR